MQLALPACPTAVPSPLTPVFALPAGGRDDLGEVLPRLAERIEAACGPLLQRVAAPASGLRGLDLLGQALVAEMAEALSKVCWATAGFQSCCHSTLCRFCHFVTSGVVHTRQSSSGSSLPLQN